MGQGASSLQQQRNRKKNRCVTDDNEFIDVFNASFSSFQNTTTKKEDDDDNKEEEENTSDNNENRNFASRTRKRLNELRELAPSTAKPMLLLNALLDEEDEDTKSKSKKKNRSNNRSWQKVFDVLDAYERQQEEGDGEKKSELIAKLREVAKAIRLAAKNTTEEEDDDDFYEVQHTSEGKPTPPSRLLSSPISKTPPPVKPRKLRAKNRKKNDDDDAKDDGENDDDDNDSDDDENATGGVYSEYVRNTDDLLVVAEKLSSLL